MHHKSYKLAFTVSMFIFTIDWELVKAKLTEKESFINGLQLIYNGENFVYSTPLNCTILLDEFAEIASNFTRCSIKYAQPVSLCEKCIDHYVTFYDKYQKLLNTSVNGTSCKDIFISQDRLDAVSDYFVNILSVWDKGNCNGCYDYSKALSTPPLSNNTITFYQKYNDTMECIISNLKEKKKNYTQVCENCMYKYMLLNNFYESLSTDPVGLDTICMDVVDAMNRTRSLWSKTFGCCKLRKTPEIIFLCCTAIIAILPLLYYFAVRYCAPIRDLPNVLKQSRFNWTFLRTVNGRIN